VNEKHVSTHIKNSGSAKFHRCVTKEIKVTNQNHSYHLGLAAKNTVDQTFAMKGDYKQYEYITEVNINGIKVSVDKGEDAQIKPEEIAKEKADLLMKHRGLEKVLDAGEKTDSTADLIHIQAMEAAKTKNRMNLVKLTAEDSDA
jgi:hypothetical protein